MVSGKTARLRISGRCSKRPVDKRRSQPGAKRRARTALEFLWRDRKRSKPGTNDKFTGGGMLLLLSVTRPGPILPATSVGFATLVHTRCAFIVSGAASNNSSRRSASQVEKLNKPDQQCQQVLSHRTLEPPTGMAGSCRIYLGRIPNYCQINGQRPPLSSFCNHLIIHQP
jgi:hypothetical protein